VNASVSGHGFKRSENGFQVHVFAALTLQNRTRVVYT